MKQTLSRRSFLKSSGIVLGASLAACCGLTTLAAQTPKTPLSESHYGDAPMSSKILVAYATRCGSTIEVAQAIAQIISQQGVVVDVLPVKQITGAAALQGYQAVIVGSAIRIGKWLPEAHDFVKTNQRALSKIPLAYFTVCMTLATDTPESRQKASEFVEPVRAILQPQAEAIFAGKFDPKHVSLIERLMCQAKGVPQGDFRNWDAIGNWAATWSN
jgi:menaquinone-dependent protoporphyrinogen oxidase